MIELSLHECGVQWYEGLGVSMIMDLLCTYPPATNFSNALNMECLSDLVMDNQSTNMYRSAL